MAKVSGVVKTTDILVKGARVHNLKNITATFPKNKFIVVTGVSGSGKSSLTIDTLYAEGQRRYAESLSAYARQFLNRMNKPDVDYIKNLCPAIAIEQKVITRTPRSTVGTMTEIYDYLRLLYARAGTTLSPVSGNEVKKDDVTDVVSAVERMETGTKVFVLSKFKTLKNRSIVEELNILLQKGFTRIAAGSGETDQPFEILDIEDLLAEDEKAIGRKIGLQKGRHAGGFYILVDRIIVRELDEDDRHRLSDSVSTAFYEGEGEMYLQTADPAGRVMTKGFNNRFELDGIVFEEPQPNLFSFNNPLGACPTCEGFSLVLGIDSDLVIPDKRLSVFEGAVAPWKGEKLGKWKDRFIRDASRFDFPIHKPFADLSEEHRALLWKGNSSVYGINDFFKEVEQHLYKVQYRVLLSRYRGRTTCPDCNGYRLRKEALYVKVGDKHIGQLCEMPAKDLKAWFDTLQLPEYKQAVAKRILTEIRNRLDTLLKVGLGYLTMSRVANTLSGGESQRIQLTRNLGSNLTNSLYILDEPSIGLHSRDTDNLIKVLKELRDLNNTVVVVEHDEMVMKHADHIIDMGPLASHLGGEVVAAGTFKELVKDKDSLTGNYLSGKYRIDPPKTVRKWSSAIKVEGARHHNLKDITVVFPLNVFTVVSGVSGSGKTTLVKQVLYPALQQLKGEFSGEKVGYYKAITGDVEQIQHIELVDQHPIGKSSRSNPVTYIKAYDEIRDLFAKQPLSKMRAFQPKHFSFNVDGGRCDTCKGEGEQVVEMQFLADVHLICESCGGKRFKEEVLEVKYRDKSIHDVLEMSVDEAIAFFEEEKRIREAIQPLSDVGLGYVKLGQSSDTLSGGEAQRVKLASFLGKPSRTSRSEAGRNSEKVLFIFDEPTTGLHFHDIKKLLASFNALIEQGHTVLVIEHNTDVIRSADWLIDLGPEAGDGGGRLVYEGVPSGIKKIKESYTGQYL